MVYKINDMAMEQSWSKSSWKFRVEVLKMIYETDSSTKEDQLNAVQ